MSSVASRSSFSPDPSRLAPEDAFEYPSRRERSLHKNIVGGSSSSGGANSSGLRKENGSSASRQHRSRGRSRNARRGENWKWKKLLWIKQPYPDNYTDASTFLQQMQYGRIQAYDFWPLVADSAVIVQHICAVALFICCFIGIYQNRISPVSVVSTATACTFVGWIMWDFWLGVDEQEKERALHMATDGSHHNATITDFEVSSPVGLPSMSQSTVSTPGLGISTPNSQQLSSPITSKFQSRSQSSTSLTGMSSMNSSAVAGTPAVAVNLPSHAPMPPFVPPRGLLSTRSQQRLATAKSAFLIYLALLGLSPILQSLTSSTSSDSIWAMSCWLMLTNIFTFDYGGSETPSSRFPASLSTNAALMASTVLASRLETTTHVFSLTLFSIEVFGLFPVFRRHLRHRSFALHVVLTVLLILTSGAGLGMTIISGGAVKAALMGMVIWGIGTVVSMGACSWWLIGLQRYKNVVTGPWDPARPIIRAGVWE